MKKKQYFSPGTEIIQVLSEQIIAVSPNYGGGMNPEKDEDDW